ncbi:MAG: glycosyltransferase family 4 protein [Eubacteriales bacterium]
MKVAIIAAASSPHTVKWANALAKRGDRVTVFSLPEDKAQDAGFLPEVSVNLLGIMQMAGGLKKNQPELKKLLHAGGFDVVNAIGALTYGLMAVGSTRKVLVTVLGPDITSALGGGQKGIMKKVVNAADAIMCPSAVCMQKVRTLYKKPKEIFIVAPGVDIFAFDEKQGAKDPVTFTFGCIKTLEYSSGIDLLIEGYSKMKVKYTGATQLKIYGRGSMEAALKKQCADANLSEEVHFMGFVPHEKMPDEINKIDVLLNTSRNEVFGVSTVEAMACKVPVIATDTEGSSEIILNGVTGLTVKIGNTEAIASRMLECLQERDLITKMGAKARGDVVDLYEINNCTEKYIKALAFVQNK